ncbi:MAG: alpha/beta hydrolase [Candidatus Pacebacteria bacterium]|nr:alpha/beta hydrolase [Candidatus Paceibacterota bacterium]
MKRLIVVHGWGGNAQGSLVTWIGKIGAELGFETTVLDMPNTNVPTIDAWTKHLEDNVYYVDQDTYFVGHSLGCQAILRYLEMNKGSSLGGAILVAPAFVIADLVTQEDKDIARPWVDRPIDFASIRNMNGKFVTIFSDNDQSVPMEGNKEVIEKGLGQKIIVEQGKGHFTKEDGVTELPIVKEVLEGWK